MKLFYNCFLQNKEQYNFFHVAKKNKNDNKLPIIKSLNATKAQGCEYLSVRMIKICNDSVTISLKIIFAESLYNGVFPELHYLLYIKKKTKVL